MYSAVSQQQLLCRRLQEWRSERARGGTAPFLGGPVLLPPPLQAVSQVGVLSQPCAPPNGGTGELKKGTVKLEDVTLVFDSCSDMGS